eukprot:Polyplicarium_translucidae@DN1918_c0_g1_i1.p1
MWSDFTVAELKRLLAEHNVEYTTNDVKRKAQIIELCEARFNSKQLRQFLVHHGKLKAADLMEAPSVTPSPPTEGPALQKTPSGRRPKSTRGQRQSQSQSRTRSASRRKDPAGTERSATVRRPRAVAHDAVLSASGSSSPETPKRTRRASLTSQEASLFNTPSPTNLSLDASKAAREEFQRQKQLRKSMPAAPRERPSPKFVAHDECRFQPIVPTSPRLLDELGRPVVWRLERKPASDIAAMNMMPSTTAASSGDDEADYPMPPADEDEVQEPEDVELGFFDRSYDPRPDYDVPMPPADPPSRKRRSVAPMQRVPVVEPARSRRRSSAEPLSRIPAAPLEPVEPKPEKGAKLPSPWMRKQRTDPYPVTRASMDGPPKAIETSSDGRRVDDSPVNEKVGPRPTRSLPWLRTGRYLLFLAGTLTALWFGFLYLKEALTPFCDGGVVGSLAAAGPLAELMYEWDRKGAPINADTDACRTCPENGTCRGGHVLCPPKFKLQQHRAGSFCVRDEVVYDKAREFLRAVTRHLSRVEGERQCGAVVSAAVSERDLIEMLRGTRPGMGTDKFDAACSILFQDFLGSDAKLELQGLRRLRVEPAVERFSDPLEETPAVYYRSTVAQKPINCLIAVWFWKVFPVGLLLAVTAFAVRQKLRRRRQMALLRSAVKELITNGTAMHPVDRGYATGPKVRDIIDALRQNAAYSSLRRCATEALVHGLCEELTLSDHNFVKSALLDEEDDPFFFSRKNVEALQRDSPMPFRRQTPNVLLSTDDAPQGETARQRALLLEGEALALASPLRPRHRGTDDPRSSSSVIAYV